ncbi:biotin--[acetyl-CoA-carboxylase] ligase [Tunicatimonas pelagia]|uniref:biotin--[acetyl-CoA-carboxylase] ligase n=1 Tax=Tunicatimonas pelagia TaxID=931531 RepID=UPI002665DB98|nr:biotin--[acetyl-CoA-carboxylase] ligase [Tunicatimonas pelagia]WKN41935.1 biotin--[acetyl-CoA-carboxylase] ligase [Tunicatimonas pelagia]
MKSFSFTTSQLGKQLFYYESCDSTNKVATQLVQQNKAEHGAVIFSEFQTQGRGQQQKSWESAPGDNLTFSLVLFPNLAVKHFFRLNILVSLAVAEALNNWVKDKMRIKWPNDIFYHDQKLGGILIQNNLQGTYVKSSVIGIGLNVNQLHFNHPRAISLANIRNQIIHREKLLNEILVRLENFLGELSTSDLTKLARKYDASLYGKGEKRRFEDNKDQFEGVITGVDERGRLVIEVENEPRYYNFHEVRYHWD